MIKYIDKYLHLLVGTAITVIVGQHHPLSGELATIVAARWKEVFDKNNPETHTSDGWDAYATVIGIIPGRLLLMYQNDIVAFIKPYLSLILT